MQPTRLKLVDLCDSTLIRTLNFKELNVTWPEPPAKDSELYDLYTSLEAAIHHLPGGYPKFGSSRREWKESIEYADVEVHLSKLKVSG